MLECAPTGKLTYRKLAELISKMNDKQKDMDVTVEDGIENDHYWGELRICDEDHYALDNGHPVIYFK